MNNFLESNQKAKDFFNERTTVDIELDNLTDSEAKSLAVSIGSNARQFNDKKKAISFIKMVIEKLRHEIDLVKDGYGMSESSVNKE